MSARMKAAQRGCSGQTSAARIRAVRGEMLDTTPEARRFYYARLAALSSSARLVLMYSQSRLVRGIAEASIRRDHPDAPPEEVRARLAVRLYGRAAAERVFGDIPPDER